MKSKIKLVLDLGNSETRVFLISKTSQAFFTLSNKYTAQTRELNLEAYQDTDSVLFEVIDNGLPVRIATGKLSNEFTTRISPSGLEQKHLSTTTLLGLHRALIEVVDYLSKQENISKDQVFEMFLFDLYLLMPPLEVNSAQEYFDNILLQGIPLNVKFPESYQGLLQVNSIKVLNEGLMGYVGLSVDFATLKPRSLDNDIRKSKLMLLDIGAGTTELIVVDNNTMVESSRTTLRIGCININSQAKRLFEGKFGFAIDDSDIEKAIINKGVAQIGRRQYDVVDFVNSARKEVAGGLVRQITSYLTSVSTLVPLSTIEDLLVFGGGVMGERVNGLIPFADFIVQSLTASAPGAELVNYQSYVGTEIDTSIQGQKLLLNERTLNIIGGSIIAKVQALKEVE